MNKERSVLKRALFRIAAVEAGLPKLRLDNEWWNRQGYFAESPRSRHASCGYCCLTEQWTVRANLVKQQYIDFNKGRVVERTGYGISEDGIQWVDHRTLAMIRRIDSEPLVEWIKRLASCVTKQPLVLWERSL